MASSSALVAWWMLVPPERKTEPDSAAHDLERRTHGRGDGLDQRRLARARFAGEPVDLVGAHLERHAVDSPYLAVHAEMARAVVGLQAVDAQHGFGRLRLPAFDRERRGCRRHAPPPAPMRCNRLRGSMCSFIDTASRNKPDEQHDNEDDRERDPPPDPGHHRGVLVGPVDHAADGRGIDVGEAEHREGYLEPDRPVHVVHRRGEDDRHHIGKVLAHEDLARRHAGEHGGMRELARLEAHRQRANEARIVGPAEQRHDQRQRRPRHAIAHDEVEQHQDRKEWNDDEGVVDRHQHAINPSALVAGEETDREREYPAQDSDDDAERQRVANGECQMPEDVLPARRRAEGMRRRRRHVGRDHEGVDRRIGRHERQCRPWWQRDRPGSRRCGTRAL